MRERANEERPEQVFGSSRRTACFGVAQLAGLHTHLLTMSSCGLQFLVRADAARPSLEMRRSLAGYRYDR
jgi:hypothetical protein